MELKDLVLKRLAGVVDPGTNSDVMAMGLVRNLAVNSRGEVSLEFCPSSSECPLVIPLAFRIREAVEGTEGVTAATVTVTGHRMAAEVTAMVNERGAENE
ncbi:MAG: DUF59 domain-containing protein [Spirochaetes bacterium]|nr:DUF59 domain-containing protein [Spirochaetota bacterium]